MKVENTYTNLLATTRSYSAELKKGSEISSTGKDLARFSIDDQKTLIRQHFGQNAGSADWDPRADLNGDGIINVRDKVVLRNLERKELVGQQFGKTASDSDFNPQADLNKDGVVNILDKVLGRNLSLKA